MHILHPPQVALHRATFNNSTLVLTEKSLVHAQGTASDIADLPTIHLQKSTNAEEACINVHHILFEVRALLIRHAANQPELHYELQRVLQFMNTFSSRIFAEISLEELDVLAQLRNFRLLADGITKTQQKLIDILTNDKVAQFGYSG